jgi:hypothetical protein
MKWKAGPSGGVESRSLTPFVIFGTNSPPCGGTGSQEREPSPELAALTENSWGAGVAMFSLLAEPNGGLGPWGAQGCRGERQAQARSEAGQR